MQALDAITLRHTAAELNTLLAGSKVSKVQHPHADEFLITVWGGNKSDRKNHNLLYINLNPQFSFCSLINTAQKNACVLTTLHKPTSICMLMRKHLANARIVSVTTHNNERIMDIHFENFSELGNKVALVLSVELMGKHSNMIFYDNVQQSILGVAHSVSEQMSQHRELTAGLPYAPPPKPPSKAPLSSVTQKEFEALLGTITKDSWADCLNQRIEGWGKLLLGDAIAATDSPEALYALLNSLEKGEGLQPVLSANGERYSLLAKPEWRLCDSVLAMTRQYYLAQLNEKRLGRFRQRLSAAVATHQKKLKKQLEELKPVTEEDIEYLQHCGDLILTAHANGMLPSKPESGRSSIPHLATSKENYLEIDPHLSWPQNAQIYYKRAKKARAKQKTCDAMRQQVTSKARYYEELQSMIIQADSLEDLTTLEEELIAEGLAKPTVSMKGSGKREKQKMAGIATFISSAEQNIYVGKTGQGNAQLVSRIAKPDDWWLHIQEMPGSHVLVKVKHAAKGPLDPQTLLEAANLAVYYSSARASKNVPVIYTQAKHVRKIPDSWPGHVTYKQEQAVFITVDIGLIEHLSESSQAQGESEQDSV